MSTYDDERVIALLHDTVPAVPDLPDRIVAIRHRAGRQRARMWSQTLGGTVAVLVVVGGTAALANGGKPCGIHPVQDPLRVATDAFVAQRSVRFELTTHVVGGLPAGADLITKSDSDLVGAATRDGEVQLDGTFGFFGLLSGNAETSGDAHLRVVDGVTYQRGFTYQPAPPATPWIRMEGHSETSIAEITTALRVATAVVDHVTYTGTVEVRGASAASYRATIPARYTHGAAVDATFALDDEGRPVRLDAEFPLSAFESELPAESAGIRVHVRLELWDYGTPVTIEAPPADQVVTEAALNQLFEERHAAAQHALDLCIAKANSDGRLTTAEHQACFDAYEQAGGDASVQYATPTEVQLTPIMVSAVPPSPRP